MMIKRILIPTDGSPNSATALEYGIALAAYFEAEALNGFAQWMKIQAMEEMFHAMKFYTFICDRGGKVILEAIDKPDSKYDSIKDIFTKTLAHEKIVTKSINNLYSIAKKQDDNASLIFLEWFLTDRKSVV